MKWLNSNRVALAAFVAPLSVLFLIPGGFFLASRGQVSGTLLYNDMKLALTLLPFTYMVMLVLGVPAFLIGRRYGVVTIWTAAATGFMATLIFPTLIALLLAAENRNPAFTYWGLVFSFFNLAIMPLLTLGTPFIGAIVGAIFWAIAKPGALNRTKQQVSSGHG
jgi:hypothetical protein